MFRGRIKNFQTREHRKPKLEKKNQLNFTATYSKVVEYWGRKIIEVNVPLLAQ